MSCALKLLPFFRGYRLQAENENDLAGWLDAIKSGTILALQKSASGLSNPAKSISKEFGLTKETGHEDLIHSILSVNEIELSLSAARKEEIFAVQGNIYCADCRSKGKRIYIQLYFYTKFLFKDPDWASLSFGILICIKCSGIHRSLGVHLSKVRSLSLDFWNPEHVELLKCIGNERSWNIFEETFDDNKGQIQRAEEDSSQQIKEKWILAKYVNRTFVKLPENCETEEDKCEMIRTMLWDSIEKDDLVECLRALALGATVDDTCEIYVDTEDDIEGIENNVGIEDTKGIEDTTDTKDFESSDAGHVQSALQRAAQLKKWTIVALLLLWGADAEFQDSLGRNLIHYLAMIPDSSISVLLSVLRKNPALGGWEDCEGRTPLQYAEMSENAPVATIIRVFQAQLDEDSQHPLSKGPTSRLVDSTLSGQDSPDPSGSVQAPKTPTTSVPTSTTLSAAFEKVLNLTNLKQRGPFKRKNKSKK